MFFVSIVILYKRIFGFLLSFHSFFVFLYVFCSFVVFTLGLFLKFVDNLLLLGELDSLGHIQTKYRSKNANKEYRKHTNYAGDNLAKFVWHQI